MISMTKTEGVYFSFLFMLVVIFMAFAFKQDSIIPSKITHTVVITGKVIRKYELVETGNSKAMVDVILDNTEKIKTFENISKDTKTQKDVITIQANLEEGKTYIFYVDVPINPNSDVLPNIFSAINNPE